MGANNKPIQTKYIKYCYTTCSEARKTLSSRLVESRTVRDVETERNLHLLSAWYGTWLIGCGTILGIGFTIGKLVKFNQ